MTTVTATSDVLAHIRITTQEGTEVSSSHHTGKPMRFQLGSGSLTAELEATLIGLTVGETTTVLLPGSAIYGQANPDLIQHFHRHAFSAMETIERGTIIVCSTQQGTELPGVIRDIAGDSVTVDFNHPLTYYKIQVTIQLMKINA